jgi:hypothetical protein
MDWIEDLAEDDDGGLPLHPVVLVYCHPGLNSVQESVELIMDG